MIIALNAQRLLAFQTQCFKLQPLLPPIQTLRSIRVQSLSPHKALSSLHCRAMSTFGPSVQVKEKIDLTEKEKQIFDRLLEVLRYFNLKTQLRVAGGWVRDKVYTSFLRYLVCMILASVSFW